jgi:hypothetical protein
MRDLPEKKVNLMRDLLFKNLTSNEKKRKIISSCETSTNAGIQTTIKRHFVYMVKEVADGKLEKPLPKLYILKQRNTKEKAEKFLCRVKSSIFAIYDGRVYLITFMHSLTINIASSSGNLNTTRNLTKY